MANDYIPRQVFQTLAYSRVQIPISCNATPHLPPRTHSHTYLTAESKICSGMIAIIISDQLCYWTKAAVVPLAWEWLFCEGICGLVPPGWMWWMGGEMVTSGTLSNPAPSPPLYNYSHNIWLRTPKICAINYHPKFYRSPEGSIFTPLFAKMSIFSFRSDLSCLFWRKQ